MKLRIAIVAWLLLCGAGQARAGLWGDIDIRAILGARIFNDSNTLGSDDPRETSVGNSVAIGARFEYSLLRWLGVEVEVPLYLTSTRDERTNVLAADPRVHAVFEILPDSQIRPFAVVGAGGPMSLSFDSDVLGHGISWEGYVGAGVRFERDTGWNIRLDTRWEVVPGRGDLAVTHELELLVSAYRSFGAPAYRRSGRGQHVERIVDDDADGDGIADADDECPGRAEDRDNYQDQDGCPDIDNDLDGVLDIADRCASEKETYNGFQDQDGCLDFMPDEIRELDGTSAGIEFAGAGARLTNKSRKTLTALADALARYPSVRIDVVAATLERAGAVRDYLLQRGAKAHRLSAQPREPDAEDVGVELNVRVPKGYEN